MYKCELCGKNAVPPNCVISKGIPYHIGCLCDEYDRLSKRFNVLMDRAYVQGTYGPWADDWDEKDNRYLGTPFERA